MVWFCTRSGLFNYSAATKKFNDCSRDSGLASIHHYNFLTIFEDSKNNLWLGSFYNGAICYNPVSHTIRQWKNDLYDSTTITNNHVTSFTEDKSGIIWMSTMNGLNGIDPLTNKIIHFTKDNGLPSERISNLETDQKNRLWIGSANTLIMLDSSRKVFKSFGLQDGLSTIEFNEQDAFVTHDKKFIYPSLNGLVMFNPLEYKKYDQPSNLFISGISVFNKSFYPGTNPEELQKLHLHEDQNFFSIQLAALDYTNPQQVIYAYKLGGFDKDWVYTRDRSINYTNVPGGDYTFYYKATADPDNWNVNQKTFAIHINTVFYKTLWFYILSISIFIILLLVWYKNRERNKERIQSLKTKSQLLEKEKALVQYESLRQQLNPHFLFNSLTSLSSLIQKDEKAAREFLQQMSNIYRYILKSRDKELVPLIEEITFAKTYIKLQQTRFDIALQVSIDINEEYNYYKISPVTLQNLLENALKHNIIDIESPLFISITCEDGYLMIKNNLQIKKFVESSNKQGLQNLVTLYGYFTTKRVIIEESNTHFSISIPLI